MRRGNSLTDHKKAMIVAFEKDGHSQREITKKINNYLFAPKCTILASIDTLYHRYWPLVIYWIRYLILNPNDVWSAFDYIKTYLYFDSP